MLVFESAALSRLGFVLTLDPLTSFVCGYVCDDYEFTLIKLIVMCCKEVYNVRIHVYILKIWY